MSPKPAKNEVRVSLHGTGVTIDDAVKAAGHTKAALAAIGDEMGVDVRWEVTSVTFRCDGCGLQRADRPDEGWTYRDGDDLCPQCSTNNGPWEAA